RVPQSPASRPTANSPRSLPDPRRPPRRLGEQVLRGKPTAALEQTATIARSLLRRSIYAEPGSILVRLARAQRRNPRSQRFDGGGPSGRRKPVVVLPSTPARGNTALR